MNAEQLLQELAGKRLFATPQEKHQLIQTIAEQSGLLPYPIPIILITGTCGKGSTAAFLSAILEAQGYRIGMIQSPHLQSFSERIQINRTPVPEHNILNQLERLLPVFLQSVQAIESNRYGALNYNLVFLVVGLHLFVQEKMDFVIVETGIGGYNDPSSFFTPVLSVITNVFMDHEAVLGDTLEQIAFDKSGVIKDKVPTVTGTRILSALGVLEKEAVQKQAPFYCLGQDFSLSRDNLGNPIYNDKDEQIPFTLHAKGDFQQENAALAIKSSLLLQQMGYSFDPTKISQALSQTYLPARFQIISTVPLIVVDGAHNVEEMERFSETVRQMGCSNHFIILSFSSDKNIEEMLACFTGLPCIFLFAPHSNRLRLKETDDWSDMSKVYGIKAHAFSSLQDAFSFARAKAEKTDGIFFTGSMFLAGDALKLFQ